MRGRQSSTDRHFLTESGGCRCGWEAQPQAFHWFPELATLMLCLPVNNPLRPQQAGRYSAALHPEDDQPRPLTSAKRE